METEYGKEMKRLIQELISSIENCKKITKQVIGYLLSKASISGLDEEEKEILRYLMTGNTQ